MRRLVYIVLLVAGVVSALTACRQEAYGPMPEGEPEDPAETNLAAWDAMSGEITAAFGSLDVRYARSAPPDTATLAAEWNAAGWRGEKIHTQVVVATARTLGRVSVECPAELKSEGGSTLPADIVNIGAIRYVLTDTLSQRGKGVNLPPIEERYTELSADAIEPVNRLSMEAHTVRSFWVGVTIPRSAIAGIYTGTIEVTAGGKHFHLPFDIKVSDRLLPRPADWAFRLDLLQNPFSVARYHGVELWSVEHFELMRPLMEMLAEAGQKNITATMVHDPWDGETYDKYQSMITTVERADGTRSYDYSVFDKWVEFMTGLGIEGLVNCYSIPENPDRAYWKSMLADFAGHLREKGWFERTAIALGEGPQAELQAAVKLVREADPDFKISFAGNYHSPLEFSVWEYSIAPGHNFPDDVLLKRKMRGLPSTFYTSSSEGHPNTFTFSPPAESAWMGWHAAAMGLDGYMRQGYNSWPEDPLHDSRFGGTAAGDTFLVYPGARSSVCFERLVEGIQQYEKVRILRRTLPAFELTELEEELVQLTERNPGYLILTYEKCVDNATRTVNSF